MQVRIDTIPSQVVTPDFTSVYAMAEFMLNLRVA
jgi:hypothetical protein